MRSALNSARSAINSKLYQRLIDLIDLLHLLFHVSFWHGQFKPLTQILELLLDYLKTFKHTFSIVKWRKVEVNWDIHVFGYYEINK